MAPDEMNLFPDREELLTGLPAKRADALLFLIESHAAHLVARARRATELFVTEEDDNERELTFFEAFSQGRDPPLVPTIQDLERHARRWAPLVAQNPQVRAAVAHRLGKKYRFTYQDAAGIRRALGLDDPAVRRAYRGLYRQPLEEIFVSRVPPADRLHWVWAAVGARLERLSPFWTAYSLTLTETVGATILALPIALATIGPLPGLAILIVLGLVNIVTIGYMAEAVTRSGAIRYGSAYLGRLVGDYLGATGSLILSVSFFVLCVLILPVFYIGVSTTLEDATSVWAPAWVGVMFIVGLYYLRRRSLNATVASALVVGAANIVLLVVLAALASTHLKVDNVLQVNVPLLSGRPFEASVLQLIFGVVLAAYFGHTSVTLCGGLVLRRDPSGRALVRGCTAAQATAMLLYCIFVLAVNGAIAPKILAGESGTALAPLTASIGPLATVVGSLFVILGMGMATVHFSLALSSITREWLPSQATPVVVLSRQRARLLFEERRRWRPHDGVKIGVTYLGLRGGDPGFRLEVSLDDDVHLFETTATGSWDILGPTASFIDRSLIDRLTELHERGLSLVIDIIDADAHSVRVKTTSSLRTTIEGAWDTSGLSLAGVLALADAEAELVGWIMRQGEVTLSEVASHADEDQATIQARLRSLVEQGLVQETEGGSRYTARLAARRGRALPEEIWGALSQGQAPTLPDGAATRRSPSWHRVRSVLLGRRGRFVLGAAPVFGCFAATEWMLLTGSGSFAGLLGFSGVIVVSLVAGIFPVLLLVASRRKGDYLPRVVRRRLGHPVLLAGLYLLFLGGLLLHGLVIWKQPWLRAGALLVAAGIVAMTVRMLRQGTFRRRLNIEVRDDQGRDQAFFTITANGREAPSHVTLEYGNGTRHLQTAAGEIPAFSSLRHVLFEPRFAAKAQEIPRELKIWVHRVTPEGDSDPIGGSVTVQTGGETKRFDIKLAKGRVVLPLTGATFRVDIELAEMRDAKAHEPV
jgi:amino acid permease/predicted transcriptional regulator